MLRLSHLASFNCVPGENMLMAEGYVAARSLASKFYGLYSLLRDLLSKQS